LDRVAHPALRDIHAPPHHASKKKLEQAMTHNTTDAATNAATNAATELSLSLEEEFEPPCGAWGSSADDEDQEEEEKKIPGTMNCDRSSMTTAKREQPRGSNSVLDRRGPPVGLIGRCMAHAHPKMTERADTAHSTLCLVELLRRTQHQQQQRQVLAQIQQHQRQHQDHIHTRRTLLNATAAAASTLGAYRQLQQHQQQQFFQQTHLSVAQLLSRSSGTSSGAIYDPSAPEIPASTSAVAASAGADDRHTHTARRVASAAVLKARAQRIHQDEVMLDSLTHSSRRR
jgi:hypothetical protein